MADLQQQLPDDEDLQLSLFPDPPPFYKHFTTGNLARLQKIEKEATNGDDNTNESITVSKPFAAKLSAEQILALPTELRYLIPPEPPADDEDFHVFEVISKAKGTDVFMKDMEFIAKSLEAEDVLPGWTYEQLYPSPDATTQLTSKAASLDRQNYLFRFARSIVLSYISLLGIVAVDPVSEQKNEKLKDILTMVSNMHALINEYRPHQARQTLIWKMEEQVKRKKEEIEGVRKAGGKVREVLEEFARSTGSLVQGTGVEKKDDVVLPEQDRTGDAQRLMWEAMDDILGP
ncbi:hypothetical protein EJ02DRAFT_16353 [Clathrospora elynae]|uniref:Mediator of RNA polymerase II transcription subunit 7 n=1 Tax=Clathrospora elynae TaxID=706981 RepID=A0A6A5SH80_9PLEO|nr:hypothetical protein EJ02DRAFT_16353 [Clathrospora elynae]